MEGINENGKTIGESTPHLLHNLLTTSCRRTKKEAIHKAPANG